MSSVESQISALNSNSALTEKSFGNESPLEKITRLYEAETLSREHLDVIGRINVRAPDDYDISPDKREPLSIVCAGISIYQGDGIM
jgi:hypothetical protein